MVPGSTHGLPVTVLTDFLSRDLACEVLLVGIQPAGREFGAKPSRQVRQAARRAETDVAYSTTVS